MTPKMLVDDLLDMYPDAEDVLTDYGVDLDDLDGELTVGALCNAYGIDARELLAEIAALLDEDLVDDDEDWDDDSPSWEPSGYGRRSRA